MVDLIATADFPYAGRSLKAGDIFQAVSERDAETLRLLRKAEDAPSLREFSHKDLTADTVVVSKPKRRYRRRDLVPEA